MGKIKPWNYAKVSEARYRESLDRSTLQSWIEQSIRRASLDARQPTIASELRVVADTAEEVAAGTWFLDGEKYPTCGCPLSQAGVAIPRDEVAISGESSPIEYRNLDSLHMFYGWFDRLARDHFHHAHGAIHITITD